MAGKTIDLNDMLSMDDIGCRIAEQYQEWQTLRNQKLSQVDEIMRYVFSTDTTTTTNSSLPWKNKTTIPKLCQIRDNLVANYMTALFSKRNPVIWEAYDRDSNTREKKEVIQNYMRWVMCHPEYKKEVQKLVDDYVLYGNCFAMPEWVDHRYTTEDTQETKVGYVGPMLRRISPLDITFNPISPTFEESPKIIKSLVSLGEIKEIMVRENPGIDETSQEIEQLYNYLYELRKAATTNDSGEVTFKDSLMAIDGFTSWQAYLQSDYCEILTFYGDIYDRENEKFLRNYKILVVDRHKVIAKRPNPSWMSTPPIFHTGWRTKPDTLWSMGPLDNLVGMQYRIDHIENLKADVFDLIAFPPIKVKGHVEEFQWGPFEKIFVSEEGDVEVMSPDVQALNANLEINSLEQKMEEMAGAPKEALGIRTPGEKTMYEVQRLENAAGRIYQAKVVQFEEQMIEPNLNAMLEMSRRYMNPQDIPIFDEEYGVTTFSSLTAEDVTGNGRIKPVAARHFADRAERIQNLNNFFQTSLGQDEMIKMHWSSVKMSQMIEEMMDISQYELMIPFVRVGEQLQAQKLMQAGQQSAMVEGQTPAGIAQDDYDTEDTPQLGAPPAQQEQVMPNG